MLCRVTTDRMFADIFYPIFTPNITVLLACFIPKKKLGALPPPEHHLGHPGGLTAPAIPPAAKKPKKRCAHISCGLSTDLIMFSILITSIRRH